MSVATQPILNQPVDIAVKNPRTGELLYIVTEPSSAEIELTYATARAAFKVTREMTVRQRIAETQKLQRYILANKEAIIARIVAETGKSRMDALLSEIFTVLETIAFYSKNAERMLADEPVKTPVLLMGKKSRIFYEPMGPVLVIVPWNYPFNLMLNPVIGAFLAGNSVIIKPSEYTPLRGLIEDILNGSGFMKDAIQIVYGGKSTGQQLIDGRPAKILFTGSVRAGHKVMEQASKYLIPVELELGGKDAMLVFEDANLDRAVNGAIWGGITNSGQTCTAVERVLVHESIHDKFVASIKEKMEKLSIASDDVAMNDCGDLDMGCMTAEFQVNIVQEQVADAVAKGAKIVTGGKRIGTTFVFQPTVVANVNDTMKIVHEETFGPVVTIQKFKTEDEAIRMSNDSPYGLSGSVWSGDLARAERVARRIETGSVSINNVIATLANPALPFGGVKESGFGRYKGAHGLHAFSNIKSIMIDKPNAPNELNWYPYTKEKYGLFGKLMDAAYGGGPFATLKAMLIGIKLQGLSKKQKL